MIIKIKKIILKTINLFNVILLCFRNKSINPLIAFNYDNIPISHLSDDYLIAKLKQESHYLEKCIKNPYLKNRGNDRKKNIILYIKEVKKRNINEDKIIRWSKDLIKKHNNWILRKKPILKYVKQIKSNIKLVDKHFYKATSTRFWEKKTIEKSTIYDLLETGLLASASSNRQAFRIGINYNKLDNITKGGSLNKSIFEKTPLRIFIFVHQPNYQEKYSCVLDVGMFAQNLVLRANEYGLGVVPCYGSEILSPSQNHWLNYFNLNENYYCYLTLCLGYPLEQATKPPWR